MTAGVPSSWKAPLLGNRRRNLGQSSRSWTLAQCLEGAAHSFEQAISIVAGEGHWGAEFQDVALGAAGGDEDPFFPEGVHDAGGGFPVGCECGSVSDEVDADKEAASADFCNLVQALGEVFQPGDNLFADLEAFSISDSSRITSRTAWAAAMATEFPPKVLK